MIGTVALTAALSQSLTAKVWYGPVQVSFPVQFAGNPYDPADNDLRVQFTPILPRGARPKPEDKPVERLAYFDEESGAWKAHLVLDRPGEFRAQLIRNGRPVSATSQPASVELREPLKRGFLRVSKVYPTRFVWDDGSHYYPFGQNVGWGSSNLPSIPELLKLMGTHGMNWTRIWACHWDGKNLWWPNDPTVKVEPRHFLPSAMEQWDQIAQAGREYGVGWQWVLFHHGPWSTRVNSNWGENPWNKANGGWLEKPGEFFTDEEARSRSKQYLRYVVARYAHEPNLIAWELFNEVEWVDPRYDGNWKVVLDWHREMAEYLRSLDPYGRLVTTSSTYEYPGLYEHMDFDQPHSYSPDPRAPLSRALTEKKPAFFGEFGTEPYVADRERVAIRRGVLASVTAGHSGAAAYWYWDRTHRENFYPDFQRLGKIIRFAGVHERPGSRVARASVTTEDRATLRISPEIGWGPSEKTSFHIPADAALGSLPISSYLQSVDGNNKAWNPDGIVLELNRPVAGKVRVHVAQSSARGGSLSITHGARTESRTYESRTQDRTLDEVVELDVPAGRQTVAIKVTGEDWIRIAAIEVEAAGMSVQASGIGESDWVLLWVTRVGDSKSPAIISGTGLADGDYVLTEFNLDSEHELESTVTVRNGVLRHQATARDAVWVLKKRS